MADTTAAPTLAVTIPSAGQLADIEYYSLGAKTRTSTTVQIFRVGDRQISCKTTQGWPFVIDRDRITAINRDGDIDAMLDQWCPVTTIIDCRERSCELHYMAAPVKLAPETTSATPYEDLLREFSGHMAELRQLHATVADHVRNLPNMQPWENRKMFEDIEMNLRRLAGNSTTPPV